MKWLLLLVMMFATSISMAQKSFTVSGTIKDQSGSFLPDVRISIGRNVVISDSLGHYIISVPSKKGQLTISFSHKYFGEKTVDIDSVAVQDTIIDVVYERVERPLEEIIVRARKGDPTAFQKIDKQQILNSPLPSSNFESFLKTLPGVSVNNELSSQYSVRGGNFDENLLYLNDIEISRPSFIRSGQQEGLSYINPELVSRANFSAGGFEPRYGDKLSSLLDVKYLRPDSSQTTASVGLLGYSLAYKAANPSNFILFGIRNKSNEGLLKTQDVKGSYRPNFYDLQFLFDQNLGSRLSLSFFANYNLANFELIPQNRQSVFGTAAKQMQLDIAFGGKEFDKFETLLGGLTAQYRISSNLNVKWVNSLFRNQENENTGIQGSYNLRDAGFQTSSSEEEGRVGIYYNFASNHLNAVIAASELKFYKEMKHWFMEWGLKCQKASIKENIDEFDYIDSVKADSSFEITPRFRIAALNSINTKQFSAYWQSSFAISSKFDFTGGFRANYNSYSRQLLLSPRLTVLVKPGVDRLGFRVSTGVYDQPPFYREFRSTSGILDKNVKSQRSFHFFTSMEKGFDIYKKPMKFSSELYFKYLKNLIPYKIEDLRIQYQPGLQSHGYATGIDLNLRGEFVEGLESSFRISLMKTAEDIEGDFYYKNNSSNFQEKVEPGYLKRPTDQRLNFSAFFQDRLLNSPTYKVHLNLLYGSGLPVGAPGQERYKESFQIPTYRRADVGFSKDLLDRGIEERVELKRHLFSSFILYAEVFNLLNINNTASFLWLTDVSGNQYAVPNYLTARQLNFKIIAKIK